MLTAIVCSSMICNRYREVESGVMVEVMKEAAGLIETEM